MTNRKPTKQGAAEVAPTFLPHLDIYRSALPFLDSQPSRNAAFDASAEYLRMDTATVATACIDTEVDIYWRVRRRAEEIGSRADAIRQLAATVGLTPSQVRAAADEIENEFQAAAEEFAKRPPARSSSPAKKPINSATVKLRSADGRVESFSVLLPTIVQREPSLQEQFDSYADWARLLLAADSTRPEADELREVLMYVRMAQSALVSNDAAEAAFAALRAADAAWRSKMKDEVANTVFKKAGELPQRRRVATANSAKVRGTKAKERAASRRSDYKELRNSGADDSEALATLRARYPNDRETTLLRDLEPARRTAKRSRPKSVKPTAASGKSKR